MTWARQDQIVSMPQWSRQGRPILDLSCRSSQSERPEKCNSSWNFSVMGRLSLLISQSAPSRHICGADQMNLWSSTGCTLEANQHHMARSRHLLYRCVYTFASLYSWSLLFGAGYCCTRDLFHSVLKLMALGCTAVQRLQQTLHGCGN